MIIQTESPLLVAFTSLLVSAWSAEFALRIQFPNADQEYLTESLKWVIPQAYSAALFSARAILAIDGICTANPCEVEKKISEWAQVGLYGPGYTRFDNPFTRLLQYRKKDEQSATRLSGPQAAVMQVNLVNMVHELGLIHETYILHRLGAKAYQSLLDSLPNHVKNGFAGIRARALLADLS